MLRVQHPLTTSAYNNQNDAVLTNKNDVVLSKKNFKINFPKPRPTVFPSSLVANQRENRRTREEANQKEPPASQASPSTSLVSE